MRKLPDERGLALVDPREGLQFHVEDPLAHERSGASGATGQPREDRAEREPQQQRLRRADELRGFRAVRKHRF